jgi:RecA-family ATPase
LTIADGRRFWLSITSCQWQGAKKKGAQQLIIIDTLARHMGGLDENNAKDMVKLIHTADKLKDDYQFAIMLVHPTGHAHQDRARGSTAFKGALDTEIIVNQLGDPDLTTKCEKQKDGTPFETRQFIKISIEPSIILQQVEVSGKTDTKVNPNETLALETLKECLVGDNPFAQAHRENW